MRIKKKHEAIDLPTKCLDIGRADGENMKLDYRLTEIFHEVEPHLESSKISMKEGIPYEF
jgi:hypothetical protein